VSSETGSSVEEQKTLVHGYKTPLPFKVHDRTHSLVLVSSVGADL